MYIERIEGSSTDAEDIRQIEAVTHILGSELGMSVAKFTSNENIETRSKIKEQFQMGDRLQAIVAIKCLDEGVNIPGIRTAFILASTTNPKEYIQRRGRVLRKDIISLSRNYNLSLCQDPWCPCFFNKDRPEGFAQLE